MKWLTSGVLFLLAGCSPSHEKTAELESRVAELEALVKKLEQDDLSGDRDPEASIEGLVRSLQNLVASISIDFESRGPQPKPDASRFEELTAIEPSPEISHKVFSARKKKDGARIERRLEQETPQLQSNLPLVGRPLPQTRFIGPDGGVFDLGDLKGRKNILLVMMRGFAGQVCIACSAQTAILAKTIHQFEKSNTQIIVVYPGPPSSVPVFLQAVKDLEFSFELPFPVLLDINLGAVKKFDIEGRLAKPTSIIIDQKGVVRFAYSGEKYDDRPPVGTLLRELSRIQDASPPK